MTLPRRVAICSYRLGGTDGVAVEAEKWRRALVSLGCAVTTVAGAGTPDVLVPSLAADASGTPDTQAIERALAYAEVVVVENLCSLPLNPRAGAAVAAVLEGRPAVLHHHDLASQRPALSHFGPPPNWPGARHVTINELSRRELATVGIEATVVYNSFDPDPVPGRRDATRAALAVARDEVLVVHPTRAIARKNVPGALALCAALEATYWLVGGVEDGYDAALDELLMHASCRVLRGMPGAPGDFFISDTYAACDVVALPSTWEGFGNPSLESATYDRPLAIGTYPVAEELRAFGFEWFDATDPRPLRDWLERRDASLLVRNHEIARRHFSLADLPARLESLLA